MIEAFPPLRKCKQHGEIAERQHEAHRRRDRPVSIGMADGSGSTTTISAATGRNATKNQNADDRPEMWLVDIFCISPQMPHSTMGINASSSHADSRLCLARRETSKSREATDRFPLSAASLTFL